MDAMEESSSLNSSLERSLLTLQKLNNSYDDEDSNILDNCFTEYDDHRTTDLDTLLDKNFIDNLSHTSSNIGSFIDTTEAFICQSGEELLAAISSRFPVNLWDSSSPLSWSGLSDDDFNSHWTPNNDFVVLGVGLKTLSSDSVYLVPQINKNNDSIKNNYNINSIHNFCVNSNSISTNSTMKLLSLNSQYSTLIMNMNSNQNTNINNHNCLNLFKAVNSGNSSLNYQSNVPKIIAATTTTKKRVTSGVKRQRKSATQEQIELEFICNYNNCGKIYFKISQLEVHLRRHTGEKPFACLWPGCERRFTRSDELLRQKRSHTNDKPHECSICTKRFSRRYNLVNHLKVHRKEFPDGINNHYNSNNNNNS